MPLDLSKIPPVPADAPKPKSRWKHWKGHNVEVVRVGRHTETGEPLVAYLHNGDLWCRPLSMWQDEARPGIIRFVPMAAAH